MSTRAPLQAVPRTALTGYFTAVRLPLTVAAQVTGQGGNTQWPPLVAFETVEAAVETAVGGFLHDTVLVERGRLRQAKIEQLRTAATLAATAERERAQADARLAEQRQRIQTERASAEQRAQQRERDLTQQAAARKAKTRQVAEAKEAAAAADKERRDTAIARRERVAKTAVLAQESQALGATAAALDAQGTLTTIEATLDGTKAARVDR